MSTQKDTITNDDFNTFKNEIKVSILDLKESIVDLKHTLNQRTNFIVWVVTVLIIGSFSIGFFFYDKLAFMNDQYSDRFSRMETSISMSSPDVLVLIEEIKKQRKKTKRT